MRPKTMKGTLILFFIFFKVFAFSQTFNVTTKTIDLELKELIKPATKVELTHAVKFQNEYLCFFEEVKKDNIRSNIKFCFIVSDEGKNLRKINVPSEIQNTVYYDLFLKDNIVFAKTYMNSKTYYFNQDKSSWVETKDADDMIFEDERFYITYLDFGEWGSTTWCRDKFSNKEYLLASSGTIINKIDSAYFITSRLKILKVENPLKLKQSEKDYYYEIVRQKKFSEGTNSLSGAKVLFEDATYSYFEQKEPKLIIATSFVINNKLYHLCMDSTKTFIAKLDKSKMIPIQTIGKKLSTFNWDFSYRSEIQKDGFQILKFKTTDTFGLIELKGKSINIVNLNFK